MMSPRPPFTATLLLLCLAGPGCGGDSGGAALAPPPAVRGAAAADLAPVRPDGDARTDFVVTAPPDLGAVDLAPAADLAPASDLAHAPDLAGLPRVLLFAGGILTADEGRALLDLQQRLVATAAFSVVDIFAFGEPTLAQLKAYDAVLALRAWGPQLGADLAQFYDGGGHVVSALCGGQANNVGTFGDPVGKYSVAEAYGGSGGGNNIAKNVMEAPLEPMSPLLRDVGQLSFGTGFYALLQPTANTQATVVRWKTGDPLVMRGVAKGRGRVDLGFCARMPATVYPFMGWSGNGIELLRNALLFE